MADATEELLELKTGSNAEITDLRHNIEGLTKDVLFLRSSNNELKIAKARLEEKHLLFTGQISKLEKERSSNKSLIEEREKEIDSLKHNFDQQHTQAKSDYDSLKRDFDKSVKELNDRRIEFSTKLAENDSKMQNIKHEGVVAQRDFENKIANLRQQLKEKDISRRAMNEAFKNDMFELNKRLEKKDIEISDLQEDIQSNTLPPHELEAARN